MQNSNYTLQEVTDARLEQEWLDMANALYEGNPYWIRPLDNTLKGIFDPKKNHLFEGGEAARWVVRNYRGEVVGRIAAFYNREQAAIEEQPTGGCGFFESINNQEVATLLFDTARNWLQARGMEAMDGPINFGPRDSWWGVLVEGFEVMPLFENPYNPPYYKELFEKYGFQNYFNQHTFLREVKQGLFSDSVYERVKRLKAQPEYRFEHIRKRDLERVTRDFRTIYNKAWAGFSGVKEMSEEQARKLMLTLKPIIDEKLIYFAHYNDEPIGFFIMVPDLNPIMQDFNGKFGWWQQLKLMWRLKVKRSAKRIFGIIFSVTPEFQGKGIESGIIHAFEQLAEGLHYTSLELAWMGDFNPVMLRMVENYVCAKRFKMHTTYRYLFDREKEFKRCPRVGMRKRTEEPQK